MKRTTGTATVDPGIYFCPKELQFKAMDERGRLPGTPETKYWKVPALAMLVVAPLVGLAYVIFLPFVGFVMLGAVALEKVRELGHEMATWARPILRPAWQPARAFFARTTRRTKAPERPAERPADAWADEVRREIDAPTEEWTDHDGDEEC